MNAHYTTFQLGVHSNIPECCVVFYVARTSAQICRINARRERTDTRNPGYVMCSRCWRGFRRGTVKPATVHICVDSHESPICHFYLSGPDRVARMPLKQRYRMPWRAMAAVLPAPNGEEK